MAGTPTSSRRGSSSKRPASPAARQILQAALREDCTVGELADLAKSDPGFAMRLLGLVNSPAFGMAHKVSEVSQAASILGVRGLRNLALGLAVGDMLPLGTEGHVLLANCLRRALAAQRLARATRRVEPGAAFTVGLLLDAGFLVHARQDAGLAASLARAPVAQRLLEERLRGLEGHAELAAMLAVEFGLGDDTAQALAHHHDETPPPGDLPRLAWAAERVAGVFEGGNVEGNRKQALLGLASLELGEPLLDELLRELPAAVREGGRAFERDVGHQDEYETLLADAAARLAELNLHYEHVVRALENALEERGRLMAELQKANQALEELAATDPLTGLMNKRSLEDSLRRDLARASRDNAPLALVVVDIDHFKRVNDTHGHAAGDLVLVQVARALKDGVRIGDVVARFGGEEFVLVLPRTDAAGAALVADRLRAALADPARPAGVEGLVVTASFGVAVAGPKEDHPSLFARADGALYEAKRAGRNRVVVADP